MVRKCCPVTGVCAVLLCTVAWAGEGGAAGNPAARIVPNDTMYFVSAGNVAQTVERVNETGLADILREEEMERFLSGLVGMALTQQGRVEQALQVTLDDLRNAIPGEVAIALLDVVPPGEGRGQPDIQAALMIGGGDNEEAFGDLLARLQAHPMLAFFPTQIREIAGAEATVYSTPNNRVQVFVGRIRDFHVFALGEKTFRRMAETSAGDEAESLAADRYFREALESVRPGSDLFEYVSAKKAVALISRMMSPRDRKGLAAIGLDHALWSAYSIVVADKGFEETGYFRVSEKKGFVELFDQEPLPAGCLSYVPSDALFAFAFNIDARSTFWNFINSVALAEGPRVVEETEAGILELRERINIDFDRDILDLIRPPITGFVSLPPGLGLIPDVVISCRLSVPEKAETLLAMVEAAGMLAGRIKTFDYKGATVRCVKPDKEVPIMPTVAIMGDQILFAGSPQTLFRIFQQDENMERLVDTEKYTEAVKHLSASRFAEIYLDLPQIALPAYNSLIPFVFGQDTGNAPVELALLPRGEVLARHLLPLAVAFGSDEGGIRMMTFSSTSMPVLGGVAGAVVWGAIEERQKARRAARERRMRGAGRGRRSPAALRRERRRKERAAREEAAAPAPAAPAEEEFF